ncbi:hypothetical protein GC176_26740 [bacterium]|nr:hypothetical protein [bacterium]
MQTFPCRCGTDIEVVPPSSHAGYVVLDSDIDLSIDERTEAIRSFLSAVRRGDRDDWMTQFYGSSTPLARMTNKDDADVIEDILSRYDSWTRFLFCCPVCGRIYIQSASGTDEYQCFTEEP